MPAAGMPRCRSPYDDSAISSSAAHQGFTARVTTTALGQIVTATAWLSSDVRAWKLEHLRMLLLRSYCLAWSV